MDKPTIEILKNNRDAIINIWVAKQKEEEGYFNVDNQLKDSKELVDSFLSVLNTTTLENKNAIGFDKVNEVLMGISVSRAKQGYTSRETGFYLFTFKEALLEVLYDNIADAATLYADSLKISKIVDNMSMLTFESFIKGREDIISRQTDEITEISTPVIKVWDGIVALPIIGTLDSARTQVVMESLLQQIVETGSTIAILDISGVPAVDTLVAQHLIKTVSATRLLGAECIISGIRPEIAQIVVHLGIDLSGIITKSTLASALKTAFNMLQIQVIKKK
ncbi:MULTISPECIES: STAS domain-containing protein [unclassified Arcicella]|uniref:STAS domain-containing protein n=1 Tax=unclassified Arcicella TaxID=2644986 RepID=UPI0028630F18|nr:MULTISPECIES: STAS domain-containing protein [unclassified Arcicella]MDR6562528.1 rsbT co-antagonist protein RsbR [Arcicella sp. BE51]MDR6812615.1 rsbT co-antagonist protein RsbR [Arcicella sp. BE140]MDR6823927.1 rsbT co-antagonist protein RsbR [Arcicella sp. BE139]